MLQMTSKFIFFLHCKQYFHFATMHFAFLTPIIQTEEQRKDEKAELIFIPRTFSFKPRS